jgi:hypothetical protein
MVVFQGRNEDSYTFEMFSDSQLNRRVVCHRSVYRRLPIKAVCFSWVIEGSEVQVSSFRESRVDEAIARGSTIDHDSRFLPFVSSSNFADQIEGGA